MKLQKDGILNTTSYKSLGKALSMTAYTVPVEVKKMFQEEEEKERRKKKKKKKKRRRKKRLKERMFLNLLDGDHALMIGF